MHDRQSLPQEDPDRSNFSPAPEEDSGIHSPSGREATLAPDGGSGGRGHTTWTASLMMAAAPFAILALIYLIDRFLR